MGANRRPSTKIESPKRPTSQELRLAEEAYRKRHGKVVVNRELQREGFRMINDVLKGKMTVEEYERHWQKLCEIYKA